MTTVEFCNKYKPCREGMRYALTFETMSEVWQNCQRSDWLFWILQRVKPLEKEQSVRLLIAFAEISLSNWKDENDKSPALAIRAAKTKTIKVPRLQFELQKRKR